MNGVARWIRPMHIGALVAGALLTTAPAATAFGPARDVSGAEGAATSGAAVAPHPSGGATVVWTRASDHRVLARHVGTDGALGAVVPVSEPGDAATDMQPDL